MEEWYAVPHAGLVGVIKYWIISKDNQRYKVIQNPEIVVKRENVRVIVPKDVTDIITVVQSDDKLYMLTMRRISEVEKP